MYAEALQHLKEMDYYYMEKPLDGRHLTQYLFEKSYTSVPTTLIPKSTFEKLGLFDENQYVEDWENRPMVSENGSFAYRDPNYTMSPTT